MNLAISKEIRTAANEQVLFLPHAIRQMTKLDRMITPEEVRAVVENGELIEDYPDDPRGHSCLLCGQISGRTIHVVCAPKTEYLAIITAYLPDERIWLVPFKKRRE